MWYLIDCTYGAGVLNETDFTKMYSDSYFAVPPEQLILTHFPDSDKWQLLEKPLTLTDIRPLIVLTPDAFNLGNYSLSSL